MLSAAPRRRLLTVSALLAIVAYSPADAAVQDVERVLERLEPEIESAMEAGRIPSATVALIAGDRVVWTGAYGLSNVWAKTAATTETVYLIGSTFKAQSTVALLQQMEQGKFTLDDAVNDHLTDFKIRGEDPERPVTFRHLLTHTSGLPGSFVPHTVWGETAPPPIAEYLADSLEVVSAPLDSLRYSNIAFTLVAHLVEKFSGVPYKRYIRENVWELLGMHTGFEPTPAMEERLSIPYIPNQDGGQTPTVRLKANVWPAGIVYGTIRDQANWVAFNLGDSEHRGHRLLSKETLDLMHTLQYDEFAGQPMAGGWGYENPGYGLTWWTSVRDGERFFAHSGSVPGYTAFVAGNKDARVGFAILTNGNRAHPHLVRLANLALDLMAEAMP